jgi:hypothetical protein
LVVVFMVDANVSSDESIKEVAAVTENPKKFLRSNFINYFFFDYAISFPFQLNIYSCF